MLLKGSAGIDQVQVETFPAGFDARKLAAYRDGSGGSGPGLADAGAVERGQEYVVSSPDGNGASFAAALAAAHDGGTIVFDGVRKVSLGGVLGIAVPFAAGKTVFVEGPDDGGIVFPSLSAQLQAGQTLALHQATMLQAVSLPVSVSSSKRGRGGLTFTKCRFRFDQPRYTGSSAVQVNGSRAAFLSCDLRGSLGSSSLTSPTAAISVTGRDPALVVRDSRFSDIGSAAPSGSVIRTEGGTVLLQNSSITGCRLWNGDPSEGAVRIEALDPDRAWLYAESSTISDTRLTRPTWLGGPVAGLIALNAGGPFDLERSKAEAELVHVTLLCNEAADPGAATLSAEQTGPGRTQLTVTNSLLAGTLPTVIGVGTYLSRGGNLCDYNPDFFAPGDHPNEDPELHPLSLGKNGTLHHAPRPGCPTIDAGLVRNVAAFDGRGGLRFLNGDGSGTSEPDVGAVESGRGIVVTTAADENDGGLGLGAGNSLRECLAAAATFGGAVNVDASALSTVTLASGITVAGHQVEIDAGGLVLAKPAGGGAAITASSGSLLAIHGVSFDSDDGALNCESNAAVTLENGGITGSALTAVTVRNDARALLSRLHVHRNAAAIAVLARDRSSLETADCTFADQPASSTVVVQAQNFAWLTSRFTTFARNACSSGPVGLFGSSTGELHRCTLARNGRGIFHSGTSLLLFGETVFSRQAGSGVIHSSGTDRITLGGNVSEQAVPEFDPAFGDLPHFDPFLGPLADDDGDGRPTMRPLARGPVFREYIGATEPPRVITVNTAADENDTPAGSSRSLREAIREVQPGGSVIFAPELNHAAFILTLSSGQIAVTKSVTIDATALPKGIDIVGRLFSTTPGVALGLHGIHLRDHQADTGNGALLAMTDGTLVASHCSFSGGLISTGGLGGALWMSGCRTLLENCTLTGNQAGQAGAIRFEGGSAEIRHSTISRNSNTSVNGNAVELGGGATLTVHGNVFFGNRRDNGAASAPDVSAGSILSLGHNATSTALPGAVASDTTINLNGAFLPFADRGGLVDTLESSAPAARNTVPGISNGSVPPPLTDARGFSRIRGAGTDWGANEHDGRSLDSDGDGLPDWWEDLYGFDSESPDNATADADGDGATLFEEFQFLTDPFDEDSALNFSFNYSTLVSPTVTLAWNSLPGFLYDVETSETLAGWSVENTQTGNGSVQLFQDPITVSDPPRKFYRLRIRE